MRVFVEKHMAGLSTEDLSKIELMERDFFTPDDIYALLDLRASLLGVMRQAGNASDLDFFEAADELVEELDEIIETALKDWPPDYDPPCLDEPKFI